MMSLFHLGLLPVLMLVAGAASQALYKERYDLSFRDTGSPGFLWSKSFNSSLSVVIWYQKLELVSSDSTPLFVIGGAQTWRHTTSEIVEKEYRLIYMSRAVQGDIELDYRGTIPDEYIISVFLTSDPWKFEENSGFIPYPGPTNSDYSNYAFDTWTITRKNYPCTRVILHHVDVEDCCDRIAIKQGFKDLVNLPAKLSDGVNVTVNQATFTVQFTSDGSVTGKGFILEYFSLTCSEPPIVLPPIAVGTISSFYALGDAYWINRYYSWIMNPSQGEQILFHIIYLQSESRYDALNIYYGGNQLRYHLSGRVTDWTRLLPTPSAIVTFITDGSVEGLGFSARYHGVARDAYLPPAIPKNSSESTVVDVSLQEKTITSPGFPVNYTSNLRRETYVFGLTGGYLCLHADVLDLHEGCCDELKVIVSDTETDIIIDTEYPKCFLANFLKLVFISDSSGTGQGFSLNASSSRVVPPLTYPVKSSSGTISYSTTTGRDRSLAWPIGGRAGNITLVFEDLTLLGGASLRMIDPLTGSVIKSFGSASNGKFTKTYHYSQVILRFYSIFQFLKRRSTTSFKVRYFIGEDPNPDQPDPNAALAWALPLGLIICIGAGVAVGVFLYMRRRRQMESSNNTPEAREDHPGESSVTTVTRSAAASRPNRREADQATGGDQSPIPSRPKKSRGIPGELQTDRASDESKSPRPKQRRNQISPNHESTNGRASENQSELLQLEASRHGNPWPDLPPSYDTAVSPPDASCDTSDTAAVGTDDIDFAV